MASAPQTAMLCRQLRIRGIVQGVGFRPFVYNLALRHGLRGFVRNSSFGVIIEVEANEESVGRFCDELLRTPPPLAQIKEVTQAELPLRGYGEFTIRDSVASENALALVSPDVATCADCWQDFTDPANRRYGYPFTNCTNCGPRYTIIQDVPYDRPATTMSAFRMCAECESEYHNPANRRFHAQPNACPRCGPGLALTPADRPFPPAEFSTDALPILREARRLLREGTILAIRGLGGFHLVCDATNGESVARLRQRKRRSDKPFALMAQDISSLESFCDLGSGDRELLFSSRRPIVILPSRTGSAIAGQVAPGNKTLGVMLPYTPLHYLLFGQSPETGPEFPALVMTSGNLSEEPIVTSNEEACERMASVADWFLFHNREIYLRVDDSVTRTLNGGPRVLRRSRGFAPQPVDLGTPVREVLACGADLKNTFCLTRDHYAILSQHMGDMENFETLRFFEETLGNLKRLFRVEPQAIAHDLHPGYMTTRYALSLGLPSIGVQHHHAHIASCMAENGLREPVLGVALDGTGYGTDGTIWGGEFLLADFAGFERVAHFRAVPLPGGDAAVRQPWRMALSYLRDAFGEHLPSGLPLLSAVDPKGAKVVRAMLERGFNVVPTSSCGRLFDAVASITGLRQEVTFEGQAAIELECAITADGRSYPFEVSGAPLEIDFRPTIRTLVHEVLASESVGKVSARFHNTLAAAIAKVCDRLRSSTGIPRICLSGGTFQNRYLTEQTVATLRKIGFRVFLHSQVPPNDGGIALGQAVIANQRLQQQSQ
jgi:hydrogenase maturation protein HypF